MWWDWAFLYTDAYTDMPSIWSEWNNDFGCLIRKMYSHVLGQYYLYLDHLIWSDLIYFWCFNICTQNEHGDQSTHSQRIRMDVFRSMYQNWQIHIHLYCWMKINRIFDHSHFEISNWTSIVLTGGILYLN